MRATRSVLERLCADRRVRDVVSALALAVVFAVAPAFGVHGWTHADTAPALLAMASCLPLVVRRRWPLPVLAVTLAFDVARLVLTPHAEFTPAAVLVALYSLAALRSRSLAWPAGLVSATVITAVYATVHGESGTSGLVLGIFDLPVLATALGDTVRNRNAYLAEVEARAERAERTREEESRRAVVEERLRIARELHDITAHHLTLVNAQIGVAHHLMRNSPDIALQALGQLKETSRAALADLHAAVGVLRRPDDVRPPLGPMPGLADLDELVTLFRETGTQIDVVRRGRPVPMAPGEELAAYRIVQEALANARRHSPGANVRVLLEYAVDSLLIVVANDACHGQNPRAAAVGGGPGSPSASASPPGVGRGHRRGGGSATGVGRQRGHSKGYRAGPARDEAVEPAGHASGARTGAGAGTGLGHGLIGMRERATVLGGTVAAGPDATGGYRVRVELPLTAAPASASPPLAATRAEVAPSTAATAADTTVRGL